MHGLTGGLVGGYRGSCACLGAARSPHLGFRSFPTWDFAFGDIPARLRRALQKAEKEQIKAWALSALFQLFAVGKGFEPPVRSHVHLFSRQAPSTTRTPHREELQR